MAAMHPDFIHHTLTGADGVNVSFYGKLFSEQSYFDKDSGELTRLKLYLTDQGDQVFSIVSGSGEARYRQVYTLHVDGDMCHISNGVQEIILRTDMLLSAVFGLCGIEPGQAEELQASLSESLKAANV